MTAKKLMQYKIIYNFIIDNYGVRNPFDTVDVYKFAASEGISDGSTCSALIRLTEKGYLINYNPRRTLNYRTMYTWEAVINRKFV